jgi:glycerol-3-phosphate dehydrogenase (NAD(P)+)
MLIENQGETMTARSPFSQFGVIGGGAWGTALAVVASRHWSDSPRPVVLWAREAETVDQINARHENIDFLPGVALPTQIRATQNMADLSACDAVMMVVPAQFARPVMAELAPLIQPQTPLILCSKGIEQTSLGLMSEVAADYFSIEQIAVLSGPSFASEVARGDPTAVTLATTQEATGMALADALGSSHFRPYWTDDIIGTEIGGALKNVIAIACGIVEGKQLGQSARAATTTRGFAEMTRLGMAMGARMETLGGLSGLGDLILTAGSATSRNFSLGLALGEGQKAANVLGSRRSVSEGAMSAEAVNRLAEKHQLDLPICSAVHRILNQDHDVDATIHQLLHRPFTHEIEKQK